MVERQEIDALLVSALYGELTPADEARLTQHLESHPTDRAVLDDLTRARAAVRDSRIFEVQLEPPQAVSAMLLQEAARRARKIAADKPSWFARFLHSMLAHPAMAAAAMLVLVVGVAGTLYLRGGDQFVEQTVATGEASDEAKHQDVVTTPAASTEVAAQGGAAPSDAAIGLADDKNADKDKDTVRNGDDYRVGLHDSVSKRDVPNAHAVKPADPSPPSDALKRQRAQKSSTANGIIVNSTSREMQPRDLGENGKLAAGTEGRGDFAAGPGAGAGSAATRFADDDARRTATRTPAPARVDPKPEPKAPVVAQPAPPPAATPTAPAQTVRSEDKKLDQQKKPDDELAWAQSQLGRAVQLAKSGKCPQAAQVAQQIAVRAPEFYQQNVVENRDLKGCSSYINAARDKENEQRAKSKPAKKASPNEVDAPTANH